MGSQVRRTPHCVGVRCTYCGPNAFNLEALKWLSHSPLTAEERQARAQCSQRITPEGTRDIRGEESATILPVRAGF